MKWILLLTNNRTWFLTDFLHGCKTFECKWNFRKNLRIDGIIEELKLDLQINSKGNICMELWNKSPRFSLKKATKQTNQNGLQTCREMIGKMDFERSQKGWVNHKVTSVKRWPTLHWKWNQLDYIEVASVKRLPRLPWQWN